MGLIYVGLLWDQLQVCGMAVHPSVGVKKLMYSWKQAENFQYNSFRINLSPLDVYVAHAEHPLF